MLSARTWERAKLETFPREEKLQWEEEGYSSFYCRLNHVIKQGSPNSQAMDWYQPIAC